MAGSVIRTGRYYSDGTPGLAHVAAAMQWAYTGDNPGGSGKVIWYRLGTRVGRVPGTASSVAFQLAMMDVQNGTGSGGTKSVPGVVLRRTPTVTTNVDMDNGAGGQTVFLNLTSPLAGDRNRHYAFAAASGNDTLGLGMVPAASIGSSHNTWMYSRAAGGGVTQNGPGTGSNQGHAAIWAEGEANVAPNTPTSLSPSGSNLLISRTPTLLATFSDPNETLNNGVAYDKLTRTVVEIWGGGSLVWSKDYANSGSEANGKRSSIVCGATLNYGVTYTYFVRHRDINGLWSANASTTFSIKAPNTAPQAPDQLSPSGAVSGGLTPNLSMRHRDPDGHSSSQVAMQVRRVSDSMLMLDSTWASVVANNGTVAKSYDGTALSYNIDYQLRGRTMDSQGAWGAWSSWVGFSITSLATVGIPSSPSGFQSSRTPGNIVAKYSHNTGLSSQAFQAQLLSETGAVIATSPWINKVVANNANVTITWAETGFGARAWGEKNQVRLLTRDSNGVNSPSWSPAQSFNINAAPSVPTALSPNSTSMATRPLLIVAGCSDPDPEHPRSALTLYAVLTTSAGTFTRAMTYSTSRNRWEYQTTSADLPTQSSYQNSFQAYSYDGIVYSGGSTTAAGASRSSVATFVYDAVPNVTLTGPVSPMETTTPLFQWTVDLPQKSYRVRLRNTSGSIVYDSGLVTTSSTNHALNPSNWVGGEQWDNGEAFNAQIESTSTSNLVGFSTLTPILLQYTPPASLPLEGSSSSLPQTTQENAFELWHEPTTVVAANFEGYRWIRWELDSEDNPIEGTLRHLVTVMNPGSTALLDATVVSGKRYRWGVSVFERRNTDIVPSEIEYFDGSVQWNGIVIHAPFDPLNTAVELIWGGPDSDYDPNYTWKRSSQMFEAVSGDRIFSLGRKMHTDASGTFEIADDEAASAEDRLYTLEYLYRLQGGEVDRTPHLACWRSGRGGVNGIIYGVLEVNPDITYDTDGWYVLDIGIQESSYEYEKVEGE